MMSRRPPRSCSSKTVMAVRSTNSPARAPLSQSEVAAAIGAALGREVRAEVETVEAWDARARAAGMGEHERVTLAAMFRYYAKQGLVGNPNTLRWLLGRPPNGLSVFLSRVAAATSDVRS